MEKENTLNQATLINSYYTVLTAFAKSSLQDKKIMNCLYGWGEHLGIARTKLNDIVQQAGQSDFQQPDNRQVAVNQLYDLVYMIQLDERVDDHEIKILMMYAEKLNLPGRIVGDILKALLTAPGDGISAAQVKDELKDLLEASL